MVDKGQVGDVMAKLVWRWAPGPVRVHMLRWLCWKYGLCGDSLEFGEVMWFNGRWRYAGFSLNSGWDEAETFIMTCAMESMWTER